MLQKLWTTFQLKLSSKQLDTSYAISHHVLGSIIDNKLYALNYAGWFYYLAFG